MGKKYLIDTNVLIDAQMKKLPAESLRFLAGVIDKDFTISFITYIEYRGYKDVSEAAEQFIELANVIGIDEDIIETCVVLRRNRSIKLPDAIIAATALSRKLTVITRNTSDFKGIDNLKTIDAWEIQ